MKTNHRILTFAIACLMTAVIPNLGAVSTAKLSDFGKPSGDDTALIKKAFEAQVGGILIVDKLDRPWVTQPLELPSNIEIVFEPSAKIQAKKYAFKGTSDILFSISNKENVIIRCSVEGDPNQRGILKMWPEDYDVETNDDPGKVYEHAEWRHSVSIKSSKNIQIHDMNLDGSGGDGIYLGIATTGVFPTDIVVKNVTCDHHYRQGLSVIAGVNCLFENVEFMNTKGTEPAAGVDFEPNNANEAICNFILRNCRSYHNAGCGYQFYLPKQTEEAGAMGIILENCTSEDDGGVDYTHKKGKDNGPISINCPNGVNYKGISNNRPGYLIFKGGTYKGRAASSRPVYLNCTNADGFATIFDGVTFEDIAMNSKWSPIQIGFSESSTGTAGNLHFINGTKVIDSKKRVPAAFNNASLAGGLENITGVIERWDTSTSKVDDWDASGLATPRKETGEKLPFIDISDMTFEAVTPNAAVTDTFPKILQRNKASWLILGAKGKTLRFTAAQEQFSTKVAWNPAEVKLTPPSGKNAITFTEQLPASTSSVSYTQPLNEDGLYTLTINAENQSAYIVTCNLPMVIHLDEPSLAGKKVNVNPPAYDTYFYVPEGTDAFQIWFQCTDEGLGATLYAPKASNPDEYVTTPLFQNADMHEFNSYIWKSDGTGVPDEVKDTAAKSGIFKLVLKQPTSNAFEDYDIKLFNIPPLLGLHRNLLIKEKK